MNYVPKPDVEGINSPDKATPIRDAAILVSGFIAIVAAIFFALSLTSEFLIARISTQDEMRWFSRLWKNKSIDKWHTQKDLDNLVGLLNVHIPFPLKVRMWCEKEPNAFALPGGQIVVTSGMLKTVKSENGLAFVLGHEIGHFVNRDHLRGLGRQVSFNLALSLVGIGSDLTSLGNVTNLIARTYDRSQEAQADAYGLEILKKVYGHTGGAEEFFEEMQKKETFYDKAFARFESTHPLSSDRYSTLKNSYLNTDILLTQPKKPFDDWIKEACPHQKILKELYE